MKNISFIFSILLLALTSCNDNNLIVNYDNNYPSSYSKLDSISYKLLKSKYANDNPFLRTSVTEFGFCGNYDFLYTAFWPIKVSDLSELEAKNVITAFITQNSKQTGVLNPSDLTFNRVDSSRVYNGSLEWNLFSGTQIYGGLEVYNSTIGFAIINGKMVNCVGNWFPRIYIPSRINVNEQKVKSLLLNKIVYLSDIMGGSQPMTITAKSLGTAIFTKMIYPVKTINKIKLHVVWQANIPDVYYVIFVDVMTGELIGSYPTALS